MVQRAKNDVYSRRALNPDRVNAIRKYAGRTILDVGCGNGKYVLELGSEFDISGTDYQEFDSWTQNPSRFKVADIKSLPYPDNSFDTVLLFEVLEHIPDPAQALRECRRVCKNNLVLTVPNCDITKGMRESLLTYYHYTDETHVNFFVLETLLAVIREAGFVKAEGHLINRLNFSPLFKEAYNMNGGFGKLLMKILSGRSKDYHLTLLAVASKS